MREASVRLDASSVLTETGDMLGPVTVHLEEDDTGIVLDIQIQAPDQLEERLTNVMLPWEDLLAAVHFINSE